MSFTSLVAPLFALQASTAVCTIPEPEFTMSVVDDDNISAEIFLPCDNQQAEELVAALLEREGLPLEFENTFEEREVAVRLTGMSEEGGDAKSALLRRETQVDGVKSYVCRIHKPAEGLSAVKRAMRWCMTFVVGPTNTVKINPPQNTDD